MGDSDIFDLKLGHQLLTNLFQLLNGHLFEGLVLQGNDPLPLEVIPRRPQKSHNRAVGVLEHSTGHNLGIEGLVSDFNH